MRRHTEPGDEERFRDLFDRYRPALLAYFLRRADADLAGDLTEEVFLVAWRRLDGMPEVDAALPWLYGVAHRVLLNQRRGARRRQRLIAKLAFEPREPPPGPESLALRHADGAELREAFAELRERDREVLRLTYWEHLPHAQIAEVLGCSPAAVHARRYRAVQRLANGLNRAGHKRNGDMITEQTRRP